jgi:hypothetical protein
MLSVLADRLSLVNGLDLGHMNRLGLPNRLGVSDRLVSRLAALGGSTRHDLLGPVVLLAAEGRLEVAQSAAERAADLGESFGPEDQQRNHQNEQQVCGLENVADHD